jgi:hypothetical protein
MRDHAHLLLAMATHMVRGSPANVGLSGTHVGPVMRTGVLSAGLLAHVSAAWSVTIGKYIPGRQGPTKMVQLLVGVCLDLMCHTCACVMDGRRTLMRLLLRSSRLHAPNCRRLSPGPEVGRANLEHVPAACCAPPTHPAAQLNRAAPIVFVKKGPAGTNTFVVQQNAALH